MSLCVYIVTWLRASSLRLMVEIYGRQLVLEWLYAGCDKNRESDHRASELHGWWGANQASNSWEWSVLSHWREESVLTGRDTSDTSRSVQQPRDSSDVPVTKPHHRTTSRHLLSVCRLRHQTELRLSQEVTSIAYQCSAQGEARHILSNGSRPGTAPWRGNAPRGSRSEGRSKANSRERGWGSGEEESNIIPTR